MIRIPFALLSLFVACQAGCGGSELGCVPVSGKVTLGPGLKIDEFDVKNIVLDPVDPSQGTRRASAPINADGTFILMTQLPDDGAVPGNYTVTCSISHYPPTAADAQIKWVFEPATVTVPDGGMSDLAITLNRQK